jgi:beta-lactam-binding protein with PASTA domain
VDTAAPLRGIAVADVIGMNLREGLHQLHRQGLAVKLFGTGRVVRTIPAAGDSVATGTIVTVYADEGK